MKRYFLVSNPCLKSRLTPNSWKEGIVVKLLVAQTLCLRCSLVLWEWSREELVHTHGDANFGLSCTHHKVNPFMFLLYSLSLGRNWELTHLQRLWKSALFNGTHNSARDQWSLEKRLCSTKRSRFIGPSLHCSSCNNYKLRVSDVTWFGARAELLRNVLNMF